MAKNKATKTIGILLVAALGTIGSIAGITLGVKSAEKVTDMLEGRPLEDHENEDI